MKTRTTSNLILALATLAVLIGEPDQGGSKGELPRAFGPIVLGMSVEAFRKVVPVDISGCVHCGENELYATFSFGDAKPAFSKHATLNLKGANLVYQPKSLKPDLVSCYFYKGKLYGITMDGIRDTVAAVKDRYVSALGKPSGETDFGTGVAELSWESRLTTLLLTYPTTRKATEPNLLQIRYGDTKVLAQLPIVHEDEEPNQ